MTTATSVRAFLALHAVGLAALGTVLALAAGLPLASRHALSPGAFVAVVVSAGVLSAGVGAVLLGRAVARPVDRIVRDARRLGESGGLPMLGDGGGLGLSRAAVAFSRLADALQEERARLAGKVAELTRADRALGTAQEHLARSERLATVGRLAAGLAHEIGNPLGAISGYVEIARARLPEGAHPDLRDAVIRITDAAARIDRILRDLLDFARPAPARIGAVAVGPLVEATVRLARVQPRFRRVAVAVAVPAGLPRARGDEHGLGQVLLNLLLNAADAMGGDGRVELSASEVAPGAVEIAVADGGPGIAPEHLARLFDPFFTTKAPGQGTGLGLAISHRLVEQQGGVLTAENGPGGGAVFRVRLPAAGPDEPAGDAPGA